jgi:very-short-patch-repair endonuclease
VGLRDVLKLVRKPTASREQRRFERLGKRCNEIELMFWETAYWELSKLGQLTPQVNTCGYRLDFALVSSGVKFAIEINGFETHSSKEAQTADAERTLTLQEDGWFVITLSAQKVFWEVDTCIQRVIRIVRRWT